MAFAESAAPFMEVIVMRLEKRPFMSSVTRRVIDDFNRMNDQEFVRKYFCHKLIYAKRVVKYGDPFLRSPLAKVGRFLIGIK